MVNVLELLFLKILGGAPHCGRIIKAMIASMMGTIRTLVEAACTASAVRGTHPENTVGFTALAMGELSSCLLNVPVSVVLPKRMKKLLARRRSSHR